MVFDDMKIKIPKLRLDLNLANQLCVKLAAFHCRRDIRAALTSISHQMPLSPLKIKSQLLNGRYKCKIIHNG